MTGMDILRAGTHRDYTEMTNFDPAVYWQVRGEQFGFDTTVKDAEFACLEQWLDAEKPDSILDVGSGHGYLYLALKDRVESYQMIDFVNSMRHGCLEKTGILPDYWDGHTLPYEDRSFDLVLSFDVLLHIPPRDIKAIFAEHARVARRWLYIATNGVVHYSMARWCFWHDYMALFDTNRLRPQQATLFNEGKRIHWAVKK